MRTLELQNVPGSKSNVDVEELEPNVYEIALTKGKLRLDFTAGLTNEVLLAVLVDRIGKQVEKVFDGRSGGARLHCFRALAQLNVRTAERVALGIEGTNARNPGQDP